MIGDLTSHRIGDVFQEGVALKLKPRGFENISRLKKRSVTVSQDIPRIPM